MIYDKIKLLIIIGFFITRYMFKKIISSFLVLGMVALNFGFLDLVSIHKVEAASLTSMSDTLANLTASTPSSQVIKFTTPTGIAAGKTVILTFDNGTVTTGVVAADISVLDGVSSIPVNDGAPTTTNWGLTTNASPVITFTTGTGVIAAGHVITITFNGTHKITNGAAGTTILRISGSFGDTGTMSMAIVANGVVAVSAEVLSSISFAISGNSINFGTLSTSGAKYANSTTGSATEVEAFNMTAGTNATTGYTISVSGDTLKSGSNAITALASNTASSPGTAQFGLRMDATGGAGTVTAPYAASGYAYTGTPTTPAQVASSGTVSATTTYSVHYLANIATLTQAGNYSTAHTYVATGNF
jgi:hypothetical protein